MVLSGVPGKKSPVTTPGIDPGTVRLAAQRLNHYATTGPPTLYCTIQFLTFFTFTLCSTGVLQLFLNL